MLDHFDRKVMADRCTSTDSHHFPFVSNGYFLLLFVGVYWWTNWRYSRRHLLLDPKIWAFVTQFHETSYYMAHDFPYAPSLFMCSSYAPCLSVTEPWIKCSSSPALHLHFLFCTIPSSAQSDAFLFLHLHVY